jgi:hypothetical protein
VVFFFAGMAQSSASVSASQPRRYFVHHLEARVAQDVCGDAPDERGDLVVCGLVHYRFRSISFISSQRVIAAGKIQPRQPTTLSATPALLSGQGLYSLYKTAKADCFCLYKAIEHFCVNARKAFYFNGISIIAGAKVPVYTACIKWLK